MTETKESKDARKTPRGRATGHAPGRKLNKGTVDEFEKEDMGIAPKE